MDYVKEPIDSFDYSVDLDENVTLNGKPSTLDELKSLRNKNNKKSKINRKRKLDKTYKILNKNLKFLINGVNKESIKKARKARLTWVELDLTADEIDQMVASGIHGILKLREEFDEGSASSG